MDFMLHLEKKSHLQVLENIVSRQGSSQLASSPLKVLASWVLSSPASTLFVIIVIRMHCSQRHFLSSLKTWNMLCCLKVHRSCSTKGFPFLNLTRFTHLCIFAAEASAMFVIKLFDIGWQEQCLEHYCDIWFSRVSYLSFERALLIGSPSSLRRLKNNSDTVGVIEH